MQNVFLKKWNQLENSSEFSSMCIVCAAKPYVTIYFVDDGIQMTHGYSADGFKRKTYNLLRFHYLTRS